MCIMNAQQNKNILIRILQYNNKAQKTSKYPDFL